MFKEINKAVEIFHRIAFGTKNTTTKKLSDTKLAAFISILTNLLKTRYEKNWYPENPDKGSGFRCIRVNGQCVDPTIVESLKLAKIEFTKELFTTELTVWVDPGVVSVRIGEDGSIGSEIVDEEVCSIAKRVKENALKQQSGQESDEGFSSRSSSPETNSSDFSSSASSSTSSSPVPSKYSTSRSPPVEYNPYCPPVHISYPTLYQHPSTHSQQPIQRNPSPPTVHLQQLSSRSQCRPVIPFGPAIMPTANTDIFNQAGFMSDSQSLRAATYSRSRALFPNQNMSTSTTGVSDGVGKMAFNPYHAMPLMYGSGLQQNYYDIPTMA
jgi:hypothetical protein